MRSAREPTGSSLLSRKQQKRNNTIVPLKLDFAAEKGHGRLGRVETGLLSRTLPIRPQHTGETRCAPLLKSKSKRLLVLRPFWNGFGVGFFTCSGSGFEKDFLANGTHFFEDGFELLVGSESLFLKF